MCFNGVPLSFQDWADYKDSVDPKSYFFQVWIIIGGTVFICPVQSLTYAYAYNPKSRPKRIGQPLAVKW